MAYCHVAISTHDGQQQAACELVNARGGHVDLAHDPSERPRMEYHCGEQEWKTEQVHLIGERQVENIHVGDRLHLGEAEDHVDDQRVSSESENAHQTVRDSGELHQPFWRCEEIDGFTRIVWSGTVCVVYNR